MKTEPNFIYHMATFQPLLCWKKLSTFHKRVSILLYQHSNLMIPARLKPSGVTNFKATPGVKTTSPAN
jgi:hypothetical protein